MKLTLVGCGCGPETMTVQGQKAVEQADWLIGAPRLLAQISARSGEKRKLAARTADEMLAALETVRASAAETGAAEGKEEPIPTESGERDVSACILLSGDSGFYSAARQLLPGLAEHPVFRESETELFPGISSLQAFSAGIREAWQDWTICSAHGTSCDPVAAVCGGKPVFFLTGGKQGPAALCRQLTEAGLGFLEVRVGENLGMDGERIYSATAAEIAETDIAPLSVMLVQAAPGRERRSPGFPDGSFLREEKIPMTKQLVRAAVLALLGPKPEEVCWDIGTGTGSVGIELAMQCRQVWGIEREERAAALAEKNRQKFGAWNFTVRTGTAPAALEGLPAPDAVFVGGSGGQLPEILRTAVRANQAVRICVAAVTLESLNLAIQTMRELGRSIEVSQIGVSRSRNTGNTTMMLAQNPVYLIVGSRT